MYRKLTFKLISGGLFGAIPFGASLIILPLHKLGILKADALELDPFWTVWVWWEPSYWDFKSTSYWSFENWCGRIFIELSAVGFLLGFSLASSFFNRSRKNNVVLRGVFLVIIAEFIAHIFDAFFYYYFPGKELPGFGYGGAPLTFASTIAHSFFFTFVYVIASFWNALPLGGLVGVFLSWLQPKMDMPQAKSAS